MKPPKYARCKIKNIAVLNIAKVFHDEQPHIELVDTLPGNCIRTKVSPCDVCEYHGKCDTMIKPIDIICYS